MYLRLFEKAAKDSVVGFIFVYAFSYLFMHYVFICLIIYVLLCIYVPIYLLEVVFT